MISLLWYLVLPKVVQLPCGCAWIGLDQVLFCSLDHSARQISFPFMEER